jgi:hypothetical protein
MGLPLRKSWKRALCPGWSASARERHELVLAEVSTPSF